MERSRAEGFYLAKKDQVKSSQCEKGGGAYRSCGSCPCYVRTCAVKLHGDEDLALPWETRMYFISGHVTIHCPCFDLMVLTFIF
jgi:hypothetical protein